MKRQPIIICIVMLCMIVSSGAQEAPQLPKNFQFIQITKKVAWDDGMTRNVGDVDLVLDYTPSAYILWHISGKRYSVDRTHAEKITVEAAAVRMLAMSQFQHNGQRQVQAHDPNKNLREIREAQEMLKLIQQMQEMISGN